MIQDLDLMKVKLLMCVFEKIRADRNQDREVIVQKKDHHQPIVQQDVQDHARVHALEVDHAHYLDRINEFELCVCYNSIFIMNNSNFCH